MIAGNIERIRRLEVRRLDTGETLATVGREAWCLAQLIANGPQGVTPLERPAPRWSDYVFRLRKRGLPVQTIEEPHGGPYRGHHARYRLDVPVVVLDQVFTA